MVNLRMMHILAAYQMHVLEIEYEKEVRVGSLLHRKTIERGVLIGLGRDNLGGKEELNVIISLHSDRDKWIHVQPKFVKPVLRTWKDLLLELPNGHIPAKVIGVMAHSISGNPEIPYQNDYKQLLVANDSIIATEYAEKTFSTRITSQWEIYKVVNGLAKPVRSSFEINDYLRENHFAAPVNGINLVEGIDFIRKEPVTISVENA